MPGPIVARIKPNAGTREAKIAEKFHAMVLLDIRGERKKSNFIASRMRLCNDWKL
jgi:hypothetical protein